MYNDLLDKSKPINLELLNLVISNSEKNPPEQEALEIVSCLFDRSDIIKLLFVVFSKDSLFTDGMKFFMLCYLKKYILYQWDNCDETFCKKVRKLMIECIDDYVSEGNNRLLSMANVVIEYIIIQDFPEKWMEIVDILEKIIVSENSALISNYLVILNNVAIDVNLENKTKISSVRKVSVSNSFGLLFDVYSNCPRKIVYSDLHIIEKYLSFIASSSRILSPRKIVNDNILGLCGEIILSTPFNVGYLIEIYGNLAENSKNMRCESTHKIPEVFSEFLSIIKSMHILTNTSNTSILYRTIRALRYFLSGYFTDIFTMHMNDMHNVLGTLLYFLDFKDRNVKYITALFWLTFVQEFHHLRGSSWKFNSLFMYIKSLLGAILDSIESPLETMHETAHSTKNIFEKSNFESLFSIYSFISHYIFLIDSNIILNSVRNIWDTLKKNISVEKLNSLLWFLSGFQHSNLTIALLSESVLLYIFNLIKENSLGCDVYIATLYCCANYYRAHVIQKKIIVEDVIVMIITLLGVGDSDTINFSLIIFEQLISNKEFLEQFYQTEALPQIMEDLRDYVRVIPDNCKNLFISVLSKILSFLNHSDQKLAYINHLSSLLIEGILDTDVCLDSIETTNKTAKELKLRLEFYNVFITNIKLYDKNFDIRPQLSEKYIFLYSYCSEISATRDCPSSLVNLMDSIVEIFISFMYCFDKDTAEQELESFINDFTKYFTNNILIQGTKFFTSLSKLMCTRRFNRPNLILKIWTDIIIPTFSEITKNHQFLLKFSLPYIRLLKSMVVHLIPLILRDNTDILKHIKHSIKYIADNTYNQTCVIAISVYIVMLKYSYGPEYTSLYKDIIKNFMDIIFNLLCDKHHTSIFDFIVLSFRFLFLMKKTKDLSFLANNLLEIFHSQDFEYYYSFITALDETSKSPQEFTRVMRDTMIEFEAIQNEDAGLRKSQHEFLKNRAEMVKLKILDNKAYIRDEIYKDLLEGVESF